MKVVSKGMAFVVSNPIILEIKLVSSIVVGIGVGFCPLSILTSFWQEININTKLRIDNNFVDAYIGMEKRRT
jgi:hypothetical protein